MTTAAAAGDEADVVDGTVDAFVAATGTGGPGAGFRPRHRPGRAYRRLRRG